LARTLKFFFYLTDADADSGPHVYVVGSHRRRSLKHQLTLLVGHRADEIVGIYGRDSLLTITGPAGKGFVEDPFGFHMGTVLNQAPRLMMEVGFGASKPLRRDLHAYRCCGRSRRVCAFVGKSPGKSAEYHNFLATAATTGLNLAASAHADFQSKAVILLDFRPAALAGCQPGQESAGSHHRCTLQC
jgi:hypothetical protein